MSRDAQEIRKELEQVQENARAMLSTVPADEIQRARAALLEWAQDKRPLVLIPDGRAPEQQPTMAQTCEQAFEKNPAFVQKLLEGLRSGVNVDELMQGI